MSYPIVDTDDGQTQERDPYVYWEGWRMTSVIHGKLEGRHQQQSTSFDMFSKSRGHLLHVKLPGFEPKSQPKHLRTEGHVEFPT